MLEKISVLLVFLLRELPHFLQNWIDLNDKRGLQ